MSGFYYGVVETALAKLCGADAIAQKGAFRGRLQHLRRLGLPSGGPGRGKAITYTKANVYELGFCLECEELGINPALAVNLLKRHHEYILCSHAKAEEALQNGDEYFFWFTTNFMSASWSKKKLKFPGLPNFGSGPMLRLEGTISMLRHESHNRRLAFFSMTPLIREVQAAETQK